MKKSKILFVLLPTTALAASIAPILTSCNNDKSSAPVITLVTTQKEWTITGQTKIEVKFKLSKVLSSDQTLKAPLFPQDATWNFHNAEFFNDATWKINGLDATATLNFSGTRLYPEDPQTTPESGASIYVSKLNFSIWDKNEIPLSTATIQDFKVNW